MTYLVTDSTAAVGNDILLVCPPRGTLVPILRGICVTTGATDQVGYVCSPLGIGWTRSFLPSGSTAIALNESHLADNPDGSPRSLAVGDVVALTSEYASFHPTTLATVAGAGSEDVDQEVSDTFTFMDDPTPSFDGSSFLLSDTDGVDGDPTEHMGVHIASLAISQGATINSAVLKCKITSTGPGAANTDYTVWMADSDDAVAPSSHSDVSLDLLCETLDAQDLSTSGVWVEFDFSAGLQSVVNRAGWVSGNSINIFVHLDDIDQSEPTNTITFQRNIGTPANRPSIVVSAGGGSTTIADAPPNDIPYGSLVYYSGPKADPIHHQLRFPANAQTVFDDLWIAAGHGTQRGKLAPASGRGCPLTIRITNDTNAATVDWALFEYYDPEDVGEEGLLAAPTGKAKIQFPPWEEADGG